MTRNTQNDISPLPTCPFSVMPGDLGPVADQGVSGIGSDRNGPHARARNSVGVSTIKVPDPVKAGNVTPKQRICLTDKAFRTWFNNIETDTTPHQTVTFSRRGRTDTPTMLRRLTNTWPCKHTGTDLRTVGTDVTVETLEIAHAGLTTING